VRARRKALTANTDCRREARLGGSWSEKTPGGNARKKTFIPVGGDTIGGRLRRARKNREIRQFVLLSEEEGTL